MRYFVYLGTRVVAEFDQPTFSAFAYNEALFCPRTGQVWARFLCDSSAPWTIERATSEGQEPRSPGDIPGSLIWHYWKDVPEYFPLALIEREFFIHVAYARRYLWQNEKEQHAA